MVCNYAVTITKATVLPEHVRSLLTPDIVKNLILAFVQHSEYNHHGPVSCQTQGELVVCSIGAITMTVSKGTGVLVTTTSGSRESVDKLSREITTLLSIAGDRLFANQVQQALSRKFGEVHSQTATVENQGNQERVTVFMLEV